MIEFSASEYAHLCGVIGILVGYLIGSGEYFIESWISQIENKKTKKEDDKNEKS